MGLMSTLFGGPSSTTTKLNLAPESELEKQVKTASGSSFKELQDLIGQGAGQQDIEAALGSQRGLASLIEQLQASGGRPSQVQTQQAQSFAQDMFAPEEQAVRGGFAEQEQATSQLAARLGRQVNDPVLRAKLAQEQTRQLGQVGARRTAFAAEQAMNAPQRQLSLASTLADVRGGLASQALANRQTLFGLGQQALQAERQFRLGSASQTQTTSSSPGLLSAIGGIGAAVGGIAKGVGAFGNLFGGADSAGGGGAAGGMQRRFDGGM